MRLFTGRESEQEEWKSKLRQRFTEEYAEIQKRVFRIEDEVLAATTKRMETRYLLDCECEFVIAHLELLDFYRENATTWTTQALRSAITKKIAETTQKIVDNYSHFVEQKKIGFIGGVQCRLRNKEQEALEIARFRIKWLEPKVPSLENFLFDPEQDLGALRASLSTMVERYLEQQEKMAHDDIDGRALEKLEEREELLTALKEVQIRIKKQDASLSAYQPTPIEKACENGSIAAVMKILKDDSEDMLYLHLNATNALHYACMAGQIPMIYWLLENSCSTNTADTCTSAAHNTHYMPMHYAVRYNKEPIVSQCLELLQANHAVLECEDETGNFEFPSYGRTPLHTAAYFGNLDALKAWLSRLPADKRSEHVNKQELGPRQRQGALHYAAYLAHSDMIEYLFTMGAKAKIYNARHYTPLMELLESSRSTQRQKVRALEVFYRHESPITDVELNRLVDHPSFEEVALKALKKFQQRMHMEGLSERLEIIERNLMKAKSAAAAPTFSEERVHESGKPDFEIQPVAVLPGPPPEAFSLLSRFTGGFFAGLTERARGVIASVSAPRTPNPGSR